MFLLTFATSLGAQSLSVDQHPPRRIPLGDIPISATISLPGSPDWMAIGFGSLWVVNYKPHRVSRVDPTTGKVLADVSLGGKACLGIVVTRDRVWVPTCGSVAINEIDPLSNRLVARHVVPATVDVEGSFAADSDSFWLPVRGRDSGSSAIAQIDRHTGALRQLITAPSGSQALVAGFGALWVTSSGTGQVLRIDPARHRVVARIPVGPSPKFMAVGEGALWVQNRGDGSVSRVDPKTNREVARIETHAPTLYGDIAVGDGAVWLAVDSTLITKIDPQSNTVAYRLVGSSGADAARIGLGSLWLANHELGQLWRIDLTALHKATKQRP